MEKSVFSEWLEKIQQESWQLELIISGFAIFGLFQFKDYFDTLMGRIMHEPGTTAAVIIMMSSLVVYGFTIIFITNLLIHVFIRGLWIGAIGLRYVSGEIDYKELNYNSRFDKYFKKRISSFDNYIEKLERLSSIIFSYTYLLFFIFLAFSIFGFYQFLVVTLLRHGYNFLGGTQYSVAYIDDHTFIGPLTKWFTIINLVLALFMVFDFIILGRLKKIKLKFFAVPYFWIYRYMSLVTLSKLWRPLYLNFLDNKFTRYLMMLAIPYIFLVILFVPGLSLYSSDHFPDIDRLRAGDRLNRAELRNSFDYKSYDDERTKYNDKSDGLRDISIPSRKVDSQLFEVFIKFHPSHDEYIAAYNDDIFKLRNKGLRTIFSGSEYRSDTIKALYQQHSSLIDSISNIYPTDGLAFEEKKAMQEKRRKARTNLNYQFSQKIEAIKEINIQNIKEAIQSTFVFKIDESIKPNSSVQCDFYIHPESRNEGMLCYFPLDSLTLGKHIFSLDVLSRSQITVDIDRSDTIKYIIPFMYVD